MRYIRVFFFLQTHILVLCFASPPPQTSDHDISAANLNSHSQLFQHVSESHPIMFLTTGPNNTIFILCIEQNCHLNAYSVYILKIGARMSHDSRSTSYIYPSALRVWRCRRWWNTNWIGVWRYCVVSIQPSI